MNSVEARLGNTIYRVVESNPGIVCIVRVNQDGEECFYVPLALFDAYADKKLNEATQRMVRLLLGRDTAQDQHTTKGTA